MGRPRKRRLIDDEPGNTKDGFGLNAEPFSVLKSQISHSDAPHPNSEPLPAEYASMRQHHQHQLQPHQLAQATLHPSLAFLDETPVTPSLDLFNVPSANPYYGVNNDALASHLTMPTHGGDFAGHLPAVGDDGMNILNCIDFGDPGQNSIFGTSADISDSLQAYLAVDELPEFSLPEETSNNSPSNNILTPLNASDEGYDSASCHGTSSSVSDENAKPLLTVVCSCLSSLYFSLDALARLPDDVHSAMRVTRSATKVAQDIIICPKCSLPLIDNPMEPPSIQAVQNLMLLGALLPSAVNSYAQILEMIERDTAEAKKENRKIHFAFNDVGGLWGHRVDDSRPGGATIAALDNTELEPDVWRNTVRAVLRLDVYGSGKEEEEEDVAEILYKKRNQLGLKDVVRLLDSRHAKRHERMDEAYHRGEQPHLSHKGLLFHPGQWKPVPVEQRNCVNILEPARIALKNLSIT